MYDALVLYFGNLLTFVGTSVLSLAAMAESEAMSLIGFRIGQLLVGFDFIFSFFFGSVCI